MLSRLRFVAPQVGKAVSSRMGARALTPAARLMSTGPAPVPDDKKASLSDSIRGIAGATGPFALATGAFLWGLSTEYILLNAEAVLVFTFGATLVLLQKKVGPMVTKALEEDSNRIYEEMSASRKAQIKAIHEAIEEIEAQKAALPALKEAADIDHALFTVQEAALEASARDTTRIAFETTLELQASQEATERQSVHAMVAEGVVKGVLDELKTSKDLRDNFLNNAIKTLKGISVAN